MADSFTPSRLSLARSRRGWSKSRLSAEAGVSVKSITSYENGASAPSDATLKRLASALKFPTNFFAGGDVEPVAADAASFRALSRMTASQRDSALGAGTLAFMFDEWIEARFSRPLPDIPALEGLDAESAADVVRSEWGLGLKPISNLLHLLELHGVRVFSLDEEAREVDAFSFWRNGFPYVLLNTAKSAEHARFDCAHELGHLVLHRGGDRGKEAEREANQFASAFLMPRASVLASGLRNPPLRVIVARKREWKVSAVALIYRLNNVGLLTEWQYRSLYIEASKRGYRTNEPAPEARETSQVLEKVFDHLRRDGVRRRELAAELKIQIADLDRLLHGLILLPADEERTARLDLGRRTVVKTAPSASPGPGERPNLQLIPGSKR